MQLTIFTTAGVLSLLVHAAPSPDKLERRSYSAGALLPGNFPDPSFIHVGDSYFATATNGLGKRVPMARSDDFAKWSLLSDDALPNVGDWATGNNVWAPDIMELPSGGFVMYYTSEAKDMSNGPHQCIGAAISGNVEGPYEPLPDPIACPVGEGGAIDPAGFIDTDGTIYVTYKVDGNSLGGGGPCGNADGSHATPIRLQIMEPDGVTPRNVPFETILDREDRDGPLVEAPSLSRIADPSSAGGWLYILFFSSNCFNSPLYDTSYAVSTTSIHGPYTKAASPLVVTGSNGLHGPGHMDTAIDIGLDRNVVFHANRDQEFNDNRLMWGGTVDIDIVNRIVRI